VNVLPEVTTEPLPKYWMLEKLAIQGFPEI